MLQRLFLLASAASILALWGCGQNVGGLNQLAASSLRSCGGNNVACPEGEVCDASEVFGFSGGQSGDSDKPNPPKRLAQYGTTAAEGTCKKTCKNIPFDGCADGEACKLGFTIEGQGIAVCSVVPSPEPSPQPPPQPRPICTTDNPNCGSNDWVCRDHYATGKPGCYRVCNTGLIGGCPSGEACTPDTISTVAGAGYCV